MINIVIGREEPPPQRRQPPDCLKCAHFKVSWDADFPRQCGIFSLKSKNIPSIEVFAATGTHCPSFKLRGAEGS